ncbi:hypothetical protein TIFTF001_023348 [Ficus carica]|uniref:Uncharacterized protein n=1 Tax=Ficus carica TaxID=3494 RepID=A0AA88AJE1_FICCA|nr:hypothetical protein TIFTF001_023348 [Ficus carica]
MDHDDDDYDANADDDACYHVLNVYAKDEQSKPGPLPGNYQVD